MSKPKPHMRDTAVISFDMLDRASALLRALVRARYFKGRIPTDAELSRTLRMPRTSIIPALEKLEAEGLLESQPDKTYHYGDAVASRGIGTVAFILNTDLLRGWYSLFQDFLIGFNQVLEAESYDITLLSGFDSVERKAAALRESWQQGVMAFAFASYAEPTLRHLVVQEKMPSVVFGNATIRQEEIGCVCSDNRTGVEKVINHLLNMGHTRIAMYVCGLGSHDGFRIRYHAYQQTMHAAGLAPVTQLAFTENHNETTARKAAEVFSSIPDAPTAVLCASDREAFEFISELRHLGISVPDQVSVTGFDNNHYARIFDPALTTVDIYAEDMGKVAANYLLNEMQSPQLPVRISLPTTLVSRASALPLQGGPASPSSAASSPGREETSILSY